MIINNIGRVLFERYFDKIETRCTNDRHGQITKLDAKYNLWFSS